MASTDHDEIDSTRIDIIEVPGNQDSKHEKGLRDRTQGSAKQIWRNLTIQEISGSLGDLGTLLPLLVSLSRTGQVSLSASLIFGGLYNIITGVVFGIPMCVQPMKAISAVALNTSLPTAQIVTAGFSVSAIVLILGLTRTIRLLNALIPLPIVRGIQLGTGLSLLSKGITTIKQSHQWGFTNWSWLDNYLIAMLAFLFILATYNMRRNPSAIILFLFGLVVSAVKIGAIDTSSATTFPEPGFSFPHIIIPSGTDFKDGFLKAGLGQLPLTTLNSVIAVSRLADDLFPSHPKPVASVTRVAFCVGMMNIMGMWFGSIPFCHGSGGLAAQYRFGARTSTSIYVLGLIKILLGLIFGNTLLSLFSRLPNSILGLMLATAGIELISVTKDMGFRSTYSEADRKRGDGFAIMVITGCSTMFFGNDGVGFLCGVVASIIFWMGRGDEGGKGGRIRGWWKRVWEEWRGLGKEDGDSTLVRKEEEEGRR